MARNPEFQAGSYTLKSSTSFVEHHICSTRRSWPLELSSKFADDVDNYAFTLATVTFHAAYCAFDSSARDRRWSMNANFISNEFCSQKYRAVYFTYS